jgi:hypothetical protein
MSSKDVVDDERRQRDEERKARVDAMLMQRAQDIRATALGRAAQLYSVPSSETLILPANVFELADEIAAYITDGTKP